MSRKGDHPEKDSSKANKLTNLTFQIFESNAWIKYIVPKNWPNRQLKATFSPSKPIRQPMNFCYNRVKQESLNQVSLSFFFLGHRNFVPHKIYTKTRLKSFLSKTNARQRRRKFGSSFKTWFLINNFELLNNNIHSNT